VSASRACGAGESGSGPALRVLYAEDDPANRLVVERNFQSLGVRVDLAENGERALQLCKTPDRSYDLILLDLHMPELSGLQVMVAAKDLQPRAKFVAITSDDEQAQRLLDQGFDAVRIKPIRKEFYAKLLEELGLAS
jgi:two-component system capsular synthesis sensor histidine kinase RcsC